MKILFLTNVLDIGGIEKNIVRLAQELGRDHEVVVVSAGGTLQPELLKAGARHHLLPLKAPPRAILATARALKALIREEKPDVIHSFSGSASIALFVARRLLPGGLGVPTVSSAMGLKNSPDESSFLTWARAYATTLAADRVIMIAPAIRAVLRRTPVRRSRLVDLPVVGVPMPDDPDESRRRREELRGELGIEDSTLLVMTMGNLEPRKSHELFIRAAARALASVPGSVFAVIGGGPLEDALRAEIDHMGHGAQIRLLGERKEGPGLLAAADIYVRPGVVEGFVGITVLEAQAVGVPVVAFETEDVKLAIEHGETGILVPNGDVSALADALVALARDSNARARLGEAGFRHVEKTFSVEAVASGLVDLYSALVA